MRYLTYWNSLEYRLGSLQNGYMVDVGRVVQIDNMLDLIAAGPDAWKEVAAALLAVDLEELKAKGWAIPFAEGLVTAPITKPPKNVICLGRNYFKHYLEGAIARGESGDKPPDAPIYFTKPHTSIIGAYDPIPLDPAVTSKLDWEAELGVIIGVGGRKISKEEAMRHVFGYTVINDVSARDLQSRHQQWFKGKSLDASCPMGPVIVTPDELPDPVHLPIMLKVNGVTKQDANTGQLMFDIPTIIADLSSGLTLEPGDVISTGTPDGVGNFSVPPEYLKWGDMMETIIEGVGELRNPITTPHRAELVVEFNQSRNYLLEILHHLRPEHYALSTVNTEWSVKDVVAHLVGTAAIVPTLMQRQLDGTLTAGMAAVHERNANQVSSRRNHSLPSLIEELLLEHQNCIAFFLSLSEEQVQVQGAMANGDMVTLEGRLQKASNHYRLHGKEIADAISLRL
jgi:2-keto-4-pentenoate hydratase/2-oxohepta-3-ene-1,7-dioic acid hydratase in catechol pathway